MPRKSSPLKLRSEADFFVCDIANTMPKDDLASMEHPIFSLSTKADTRIRYYEHNGNGIKVVPSVLGLATIHDKDILIYCISQIIAKMNNGESPNRTVRLKARDLLLATDRDTSGRGYKLLKDAFERLAGTRITTDIETNGKRIIEGFGLIDKFKIIIEDPKTERMVEVEITLSEWMYNSVIGKEVLTISKDYFKLRGALDRRIYELARKHCGKQAEWRVSLENLQKKCGSISADYYFKYMVAQIAEKNQIPEYEVAIQDKLVVFKNRQAKPTREKPALLKPKPMLDLDTYEKARRSAPGYDVYFLEKEWLKWWEQSGKPELKSPDAAFIGFCRQKYQKGYK
jgi:plasmid replication initiation protein